MRSRITVIVCTVASVAAFAGSAAAFGPGGWDHLGDGGTLGSWSLNGDALALESFGQSLLVGGKFTEAGGIPGANQIASWDGTNWHSFGPPDSFSNSSAINTITAYEGKVYVGGTFINAGGNPNADYLAMWDGSVWKPFCNAAGPAFHGTVYDLQIIGSTLYVGGAFQNGAGIDAADYLLACDLTTGASSSTVDSDGDYSGAPYALAADSNGVLYAAGTFVDLDGNPASDYVARYSGGSWSNMGGGPGPAFGAVEEITRSIAASGTNVYIGSDDTDISGIPQADHVALWNGASWAAVGSNPVGDNGYFDTTTFINTLNVSGSHVYAGGQFQNAGGDATADNLVDFNGLSWKPVGSDGAGGGALPANVEVLATYKGKLHAGGDFTSAGGDHKAAFIARYDPDGANPVNTFKFSKLKLNKNNGTATLAVRIPGPGVLKASGKGIKPVRKKLGAVVSAAGKRTVKLMIRPNRKTKTKLRKKGKAKVAVRISFTPTGGTARVKTKKVKLVKRR